MRKLRLLDHTVWLAILGVAIISSPTFAWDIHPTAGDVASLRQISGAKLSPDGSHIVYVVGASEFDPQAEFDPDDELGGWRQSTTIWLVSTVDEQQRQLTRDNDDSSPTWSPDNRHLAFIRNFDDSAHLMVIPIDGGEPRRLALDELEPGNPQWSPDGTQLAFTAEPPLSDSLKQYRWRTGGVELFDEDWYPTHLWTVAADGGPPKQITTGPEHVVEYQWHPHSDRLAVLVSPSSDPYVYFHSLTPIIVATDGTIITRLEKEPVLAGDLQWSVDGNHLSYLYESKGLSVFNWIRRHDLVTGESNDLAGANDWTIMAHAWIGDDILVHTIDRTRSGLYRINLADSVRHQYHLNGRTKSFEPLHLDGSRSLLTFVSSNAVVPRDVGLLELDTGRHRICAHPHPDVARWNLASVETIHWRGPEGNDLEGLYYRPAQTTSKQIPPLMVMPHGGPDWVSTQTFDEWAHFFAAHGFAVFKPNYRGGVGYGFAHYEANRGRLGEIEYMDIESGVDHLIDIGLAHHERLVYGGWSWGGYLTAWTIGHTRRYRAAFVGAGVGDVRSNYVTSDINHGIVTDWEYKGNPWQQSEHFERANPVRFLAQAKTPTLVVHGREDERVNFAQGLSVYRALFDVGCEVRFLAYPREPHGFDEPAHQVHMLEAWLDWYRDHLIK